MLANHEHERNQKTATMSMHEPNNERRFADGFIVGWQSLVSPCAATPDIPMSYTSRRISSYFQGLFSGIEAAKKFRAKAECE